MYRTAFPPFAPPEFASCCSTSASACVLEIGFTVKVTSLLCPLVPNSGFMPSTSSRERVGGDPGPAGPTLIAARLLARSSSPPTPGRNGASTERIPFPMNSIPSFGGAIGLGLARGLGESMNGTSPSAASSASVRIPRAVPVRCPGTRNPDAAAND